MNYTTPDQNNGLDEVRERWLAKLRFEKDAYPKEMEKISTTSSLSLVEEALLKAILGLSPQEQTDLLHVIKTRPSNLKRQEEKERKSNGYS
jgi:hypothetical protein